VLWTSADADRQELATIGKSPAHRTRPRTLPTPGGTAGVFGTRTRRRSFTLPDDAPFEVRDEDVARLSPFLRHHINVLGRYSFQLPELPGGLRPLRDKHATDDE
jgi:hypothetical protein